MALLLLTIDVAWSIFARATLQHAVREGVRFAITGQILPQSSCISDSVQQVVSKNSFGFIPASKAANYVTVSYLSPTEFSPGHWRHRTGRRKCHPGFRKRYRSPFVWTTLAERNSHPTWRFRF